MSLSSELSKRLSRFESYNNSEVYNLKLSKSLVVSVSGRMVSGFTGFIVIILLLMVTFSSAANSVVVLDLGGSKAYTADVIITEKSGPDPLTGSLNEGDSIEFGYLLDQIEWNYTQEMRITEIVVSVNWDATGGAGPGRQVTFEVSSDNNTVGESQNDGGGGGDISITWPINPLPETVSDTADSPEDFISSFEKNGEWMGGRFTFTQASQGSNLPGINESVSYTITLTYYTWEFENIRELAEI